MKDEDKNLNDDNMNGDKGKPCIILRRPFF